MSTLTKLPYFNLTSYELPRYVPTYLYEIVSSDSEPHRDLSYVRRDSECIHARTRACQSPTVIFLLSHPSYLLVPVAVNASPSTHESDPDAGRCHISSGSSTTPQSAAGERRNHSQQLRDPLLMHNPIVSCDLTFFFALERRQSCGEAWKENYRTLPCPDVQMSREDCTSMG
jgi:hypothetical protein